MLSALVVENFLIIERIEADFGRGMTVLSGETGTGKSILVDALELALGGRAQSHWVRPGADKLSVSIVLNLDGQSGASQWLKRHSMESGENSCVIRRIINVAGRSQAFINGSLSTLEQLRAFTMLLVDVVGQNSQQQVLDRSRHLALLDQYSDHGSQLLEMQALYRQWRKVNEQLNHRDQQSQMMAIKRQWLSQQCEELEQAEIKAGEFEEVERAHRILSQKEKLNSALVAAYDMLDAESQHNAISLLSTARTELQSLAEIDSNLEEIGQAIDDALERSGDAAREIRRYLDHIDMAQDEFDALERRLRTLSELARKYKTQADLLPQKLQQARAELNALDDSEHSSEQLQKRKIAIAEEYKKIARIVSRRRRQSAQVLEAEVEKLLRQLNMPQARFKIGFDAAHSTEPSPNGYERVEFMLCANPGQKLQTLAKAASGGERSRISLALQLALSKQRTTPVLVFDEVDSGVGGATAAIVGRLLKKLSTRAQVFCITHLAQIASQADHHYYVEKSLKDQRTSVFLSKLDEATRPHELARMIAGTKISKQSLEHARQMLDAAE